MHHWWWLCIALGLLGVPVLVKGHDGDADVAAAGNKYFLWFVGCSTAAACQVKMLLQDPPTDCYRTMFVPQFAFNTLQRVSPVSHGVCNVVKRVVIIFSSVIFFHQTLTTQVCWGVFFTGP